MDGARLWEVQPFYAKSLEKICGLFDSVYVSFYKGLGGMSGAMLCGTKALAEAAVLWRTRLGGAVFTMAPHWIDAREQLQLRQDGFDARLKKLRKVVKALSDDPSIKHVVRFEPPVPEACLVHVYVSGDEAGLEASHARVMKETGIRLWNRLRGPGYPAAQGMKDAPSPTEQYFEWNMGPANSQIPTQDFLQGWQALAMELMTPD